MGHYPELTVHKLNTMVDHDHDIDASVGQLYSVPHSNCIIYVQ